MAKERVAKADQFPYRKDPDGKPLCRFCNGPVKPPKLTFCSPECVHEYRLVRDTTYCRHLVFERDKGVCAECGTDTVALKKQYVRLGTNTDLRLEMYIRLRDEMKWPKGFYNRRTWWDMDHILPVVKGGGACGLDNLQTLCLGCHKKKTAAMLRKVEQTPSFFEQTAPFVEQETAS